MIGDRDLRISRESNSTPWLTDIIWSAAKGLKRREFLERETAIEDDHLRVPRGGRPGGRHHRPRLPRLAHRRRHAGQGLGRLAAGGGRCPAGGAAGDREAPGQAESSRVGGIGSVGTARATPLRERWLEPSAASVASLADSLRRDFAASSQDLAPLRARRRRLGLREDPLDDLVGHRQPALLQPEHDVRLA